MFSCFLGKQSTYCCAGQWSNRVIHRMSLAIVIISTSQWGSHSDEQRTTNTRIDTGCDQNVMGSNLHSLSKHVRCFDLHFIICHIWFIYLRKRLISSHIMSYCSQVCIRQVIFAESTQINLSATFSNTVYSNVGYVTEGNAITFDIFTSSSSRYVCDTIYFPFT